MSLNKQETEEIVKKYTGIIKECFNSIGIPMNIIMIQDPEQIIKLLEPHNSKLQGIQYPELVKLIISMKKESLDLEQKVTNNTEQIQEQTNNIINKTGDNNEASHLLTQKYLFKNTLESDDIRYLLSSKGLQEINILVEIIHGVIHKIDITQIVFGSRKEINGIPSSDFYNNISGKKITCNSDADAKKILKDFFIQKCNIPEGNIKK